MPFDNAGNETLLTNSQHLGDDGPTRTIFGVEIVKNYLLVRAKSYFMMAHGNRPNAAQKDTLQMSVAVFGFIGESAQALFAIVGIRNPFRTKTLKHPRNIRCHKIIPIIFIEVK